MIEKRHIIDLLSGEVINTIIVDDAVGYDVEDGHLLGPADEQVSKGWSWDGSQYVAPIQEDDPITHAHVDAERDRRINGGFSFGGHEYQTNWTSRENIGGAIGLAIASIMVDPNGDLGLRWAFVDRDFTWTDADNVEVPMTAMECLTFCQRAMGYKAAIIKAARSIKNEIETPADFHDDSHWPSRILD